MKHALLFICLMITVSLPALAAEKTAKTVEIDPQKTPVSEWMTAENKLIDTLNKEGKEDFYILRNKYSVIRSIRVVERDVGNAVKACGKSNADMKNPMDARFKDWQNAVDPILVDAEKFLNKEIDEQQLVYPTDFRHVLKMNDKAFEYSESKIKKQVVTSKEACSKLLDSMDSTEDRLVELLQDILVPSNVIRERTDG